MKKPFLGEYPITQKFGENPGNYPKTCRLDGSHNGVDWGMRVGVPILAAMDGVITRADMDKTGYGIHVRIKHFQGDGTIYGHLSKLNVIPGDKVKAGDLIGWSGNTGNSTGPHLHFEYRSNLDNCKSCANPLKMIDGNQVPSAAGDVTVHVAQANIRMSPSMNGRAIGMVYSDEQLDIAEGIKPVSADGHLWRPVVMWIAGELVG